MRRRSRSRGGLQAAPGVVGAHAARTVAGAAAALAALGTTPARADCVPATRQSTCFDADELWLPAAPSPFIGIASGRAPGAGRWSVGVDTTYLSRPVLLRAGSPDPNGREVRVIDDVVDVAVTAAYSPVRHLELTAIVPGSLYRSGTGLTFVTSQSGPQIPATVLRDIRLGAAHDLWQVSRGAGPFDASLAARLDLALPTGEESSFAGERSPVVAPSLSFDLEGGDLFGRHDVLFAAAQAGARLRRPVELAGARLGTQLVSTLGVGLNVLGDDKLAVAVEGWVLPTLLSQARTLPDGTRVTDGALVPAEWMVSARTRLDELSLALGAGSAIPLSSESRTATDGETATTYFAGVTSPRLRAVFVIRYAPGTGSARAEPR